MTTSNKTLLRDEFKSEMEELSHIEVGTEQYKIAVDGITKLADRLIEIDKIDQDRQERIENREIETELKLMQIKEDRKDRRVKNIISAVGTGGGIGLAVWGTITSLKFDKEDIISTTLGRDWVKKTISFFKK